MNELNLKTATFTRSNANGVQETQTMSVRRLVADYRNLTSYVVFEGYANENGIPIEHGIDIALDLTDPVVAQAVAVISGLIWSRAQDTPLIKNYELVDGEWKSVSKSLDDLDAIIEDADLSKLLEGLDDGQSVKK